MRSRWFAILFCVLFTAAQEPPRRPVTVDDIFTLAQVSDAQISPDGRSVAYVLTRVDEARNRRDSDLWLVREDAAPRPLTSYAGRDASPRWSPDGKSVAFLRTRTEGGPGATQIFLLSLDGGEPQPLTEQPLSVNSFAWSPDGKLLYFLAPERERPAPAAGGAYAEDEDRPRAHLWRLELLSGKKTQLTSGPLHLREFAVSPTGEMAAVAAAPSSYFNDGPKSEIYLVALNATPPAPLKKLTLNAWSEGGFAWRPDGSGFLFLAAADAEFQKRALQSRAFFFSLHEGAIQPLELRELAARGAVFPGPVERVAWADLNSLLLVAAKGTGQHIYLCDFSSGALAAVTRGDEVAGGFSVSADGERIAFVKETPARPADVYSVSIPPLEPARALTDHNPQVRTWQLAKFDVVSWKASDGVEIEGILWTPEGNGPWPLLTLIHGGPASADTAGFAFSAMEYPHLLAALGVAVFQPNYRGSTNYGEDFAARSVGDRNARDARDIEEGIDAVVKAGIADPDRLAVAGWSAGGVLTNWLITRRHYRAAISGAGVSDWRMQYFLSDYTYGSDFYFSGTPWQRNELYWERSPLRWAAQVRTPTLIHVGGNDERVPPAHSRAWFRALREHGVTARFLVYPGEPHSLQQPASQRRKIGEDLAWLKLHLLPRREKNARVLLQTSLGEIEMEVDAARAPITAANFLRYVDAGFYTGGRFHRAVRSRPDNQPQNAVKIEVIQAGADPRRAKEMFAPIPLERTRITGLLHKDGVVSMARLGPDTAAGDFFICVGDQPELDFGGRRNPDGQGFAAFGRVVRGMDVVRKIHAATAEGQSLTPPVAITSARRL
jgi:dipeptidyl aminopeptidase/acylaminoacyl peptidase/cyclophilin family peptidyl-prolyl cis-trans isomerase